MSTDTTPEALFGTSASMRGTAGGVAPGTTLLLPVGEASVVQTVRNSADQWRVDRAFTLTGPIGFYLVTAPTGAAFNLQVRRNGTSIYTTIPRIDVSTNSSLLAATQAVYDAAQIAFAVGDIFRVDVTQIGSTVAGAGLRYTVPLTYTA